MDLSLTTWLNLCASQGKESHGDAIDQFFRLGKNLNQRDTIAVRKMVDGYIKLLYPNGKYTKEDVEECLRMALEMRRRVKEAT